MKTMMLSLVRFRWLAVAALFTAGTVAQAQVVVTWQAATTNGIGDSAGTPLVTGSLLRLGTFLIDDATIQANANNYGFLNANFVVFDSTAVGTGAGAENIDGYWTRVSPSVSADSLGVAGERMYLWAFNATTALAATEHGIFTAATANWVFPHDNAVPNFSTIELNEVTSILVGGYGTGSSSATGSPESLFNLAPIAVPEPCTTTALVALGALALAGGRRCLRGNRPAI